MWSVTGMLSATDRLVRVGFLVGVVALGVAFAENVVAAVVGLLVLYGLWLAVTTLLVPRSRLLAGMVLIALSMPLLMSAFELTWVLTIGVPLFVHGNWLAFEGATRLGP